MTTTNDPLVGSLYDGRYRIERRIGAGGMANVYVAEDETLGRRVAIKVLHQRYAEDSQFIERFQREASAAARLNHPNIVQVYDRGHADHTYYIAMEYVDGMTLKELVQRRGKLTEQEVLAYGRQALHALRFAHRNGIVHRDVKPHNFMVDTDGRLKIADFGIARAGADAGLTEAGSIVGTAQYLSPEQAQGHDVNAPSDLYSLGVVMYEMATGRVPFDGDMPVNVALKHVQEAVPRPSSINPDISPELESIILKAMEKSPDHRYRSADEMLADLDRAREGTATQAMTQVMGGAAASQATRVTPITPTPVAPPVSNRVYEQPIPPEPVWPGNDWDDDEREPRRSPWRWLLPLLLLLLIGGAIAYALLSHKTAQVTVPDVSGKTVVVAKRELKDAKLLPGTTSQEFSDSVPTGRVISTSPQAGDQADENATVDLVVSKGAEQVTVPDVTDEPFAQAKQELTDAGFQVAPPKRQVNADKDPGTVLSQSPEGNSKSAKGETVQLTIAMAQTSGTLDDLSGNTVDEATATLDAMKLNLQTKTVQVDSEQAAGTVVSTSPAAGAKVTKGQTVTLNVASGNNKVPDLSGLTQTEAQQKLSDAGFQLGTVTKQSTTDQAQVDHVISSDPSSGSSQQVNSSVDIVIGEAQSTETTPADQGTQNGGGTGNAGGTTPPVALAMRA